MHSDCIRIDAQNIDESDEWWLCVCTAVYFIRSIGDREARRSKR